MTKIVGIDEVGLGSWAGPLVVCAFQAPDEDWTIPGLNDSKKLSKTARGKLGKLLMRDFAQDFVLIRITSEKIDEQGIGRVLPKAMSLALERLIERSGVPDRVIIDGENKGLSGAEYYPRADGNFPCVMAASVIAKVYRDDLMGQFAVQYPGYGFEKHMGYGTQQHQEALRVLGMSPLHRRSFEPMRSYRSQS